MINKHSVLPKKFFPFIWHFVRKHKMAASVYIFLAIAGGFWGPFNNLLIKHLINLLPNVHDGNIRILIFPASLIVLNFIIFDNFVWRGVAYIRYRVLPFILNEVDCALLNYILQHSHQFFQERMTGKLSRQIFNLIDGVERVLSSNSSNILRAISLLIMAFIVAYYVNPVFLFVLIAWSISFFSISFIMSSKVATLSENQASKEVVLGGQIIDSLTHSFSINLFARRKQEIVRRIPALTGYRKAFQKKERYSLIMWSIQGGLIAIMMSFAVYFLVYLYGKNLVTIGDFALILGLFMETSYTMWFTMSEVNELNKVIGRCKQSLFALIIPLEIQDKPHATTLKCSHGQIVFNKVKFHYKGDTPLFENTSIEIKAGQRVGLVGYSGSGKTTFANLILRFYDVTDGSVLIDGQNVRDVTQVSLRKNVAMIPQDPALFNRSLMDNIRYGRANASNMEVIEAAKKAHAHEFIIKLPHGYRSMVGDRGIRLSGGQRQRIAIARAILKNAPILIFDEATSQLDSLTENLIQDSLWELMQNRTTLVIAHRLSTLLNMDRILVFDKGKIVQDGTHDELLAEGKLYKELWTAQIGGFLDDKKKDFTK